MKILYIFLSILYSSAISSQTTIVLQPDAAAGKDARIFSLNALANYGTDVDFIASFLDYAGEEGTTRSLIQFDLSSIPKGEGIIDARLSLYHNGESSTPGQTGSNASYLRRIVVPWDENTVAWAQQPVYVTDNQVLIPESVNPTQDYQGIDVTALVRDMVAFPNNSHGFMLMNHTETQIGSMKFASSDASNINLHPTLEITYGTVANKEIDFRSATIQPNPFTNSFIIRDLPGEYSITISNVSGKKVYSAKAERVGNDLIVNQLEGLPAGMYVLNIAGEKTNYNGKVFKASN